MDNLEEVKEDFSTELEDGIFSMIISLCQHRANFMPVEAAKELVAQYLEKLIAGLRYVEEDPLKGM